MDKNLLGIIISFMFVFLILISSTILGRLKLLSNEGTRKFIHISVSNWWIIGMSYYDNKTYASIVPVVFIILNYISYRFNVIKTMERRDGKNDLGTVYFPVSLLVLVLITFSNYSHPYVGALGILIMGYGDGFAAIIGKKFGRQKFYVLGNEKTIEGSLAMFAFSFIIASILFSIYAPAGLILKAVFIAAIAAFIEALSPYGLDNLTVPILISLIYQFVFFR
jgi:phytol kinase